MPKATFRAKEAGRKFVRDKIKSDPKNAGSHARAGAILESRDRRHASGASKRNQAEIKAKEAAANKKSLAEDLARLAKAKAKAKPKPVRRPKKTPPKPKARR